MLGCLFYETGSGVKFFYKTPRINFEYIVGSDFAKTPCLFGSDFAKSYNQFIFIPVCTTYNPPAVFALNRKARAEFLNWHPWSPLGATERFSGGRRAEASTTYRPPYDVWVWHFSGLSRVFFLL